MYWKKKGHIFTVNGQFEWMNSHAQVPTVLDLGETLRIFFSTRKTLTESKIGWLDVEASNPSVIKYLHNSPVLDNGLPGCFDEHGTMPSSIILTNKNDFYLFYSGWSQRITVPYSNLAGVAKSHDGKVFTRIGDGPVFSLNLTEPYSATSPFIFYENDKYYAFYCSGNGWHKVNDKFEHTYDIKLATSFDGVEWNQKGVVCINSSFPYEAITRPTILKLNNIYHMWFCYRGSEDFRGGSNSYRIGYAFSENLIEWNRNDALSGIDVSLDGWDSEMVAYPYVIKTKFGVYMFYNGNGFGKSGFGYAKLIF